jgi:hypothetical protein
MTYNEKRLFRLGKRNLENYLCDPLNIYFLIEYLIKEINQFLDSIKPNNMKLNMNFNSKEERIKEERKEERIKEIENLLKEISEIRNNLFQNIQSLQSIVNNFSDYFKDKGIIDLGVSGENFDKTKIKIKIKEQSNLLEIEYPNWLLFCNLKKNGYSKIGYIFQEIKKVFDNITKVKDINNYNFKLDFCKDIPDIKSSNTYAMAGLCYFAISEDIQNILEKIIQNQ